MKPDVKHYNPDPDYLRQVIDKMTDPDILLGSDRPSQRAIARRLGVPERTFRAYLTNQESGTPAPYSVQFCLESLANWRIEQ